MNAAAVEEVLRRAVRTYEGAYGPDDPRLAAPLSALGRFCQEHGRLAEAERLYRRVLAIVGPSSASTSRTGS